MSQVLEKPILLDETGQEIVEKLDDIKNAIGTSSEFIPVSLRVTTPPTKTIYKTGERLDLTGMVVNLIGSNGVQIDVTSACTFNPANGTVLTTSDTSVAISYLYQHDGTTFTTSQALTIRELSSIAVTTPPVKTAYQTGETLDLTGIVVTATYSDGFTANVTSNCTFNPANGTVLSSSDTSVTITYIEGSITKTTSVAIGVKELVSISVATIPTKVTYYSGETLDLTGIVVMASYDDLSTLNITSRCTFSPDDGDTLTTSDTSISISYTEGTVTKTTSQVITVKELVSIAVTTAPTKTDYDVGETLDLTGMVVTATYHDNSTENVTNDCTYSPVEGTTLATTDTAVSITCAKGTVTKTTSQSITVEYPIYGAEWDGTATTAWSRTDKAANYTDPNPYYSGMTGTPSSPFDNIMPWSGMQIVEDDNAGTMVSIPKFWYKLTKDGSKLKIQISMSEFTGARVSPAHMDRGDNVGVRDVVYVGRYHSANDYKSKSGQTPLTRLNRSTIRNNLILGTGIYQWDFATLFTIWLLYLVEFANWDSQTKIGYGCGNNSSVQNTGYTDSMPYHTGTTKSSRTTYGLGTQYRYIEGLWDNVYDFIDGCYGGSSKELYVILNPVNFSDTTGGIYVNDLATGYPSSFSVENKTGLFPMFCPSGAGGSNSTYVCDLVDCSSPYQVVYRGGSYRNTKDSGMFNYMGNMTSASGGDIGCRLMKLPANS